VNKIYWFKIKTKQAVIAAVGSVAIAVALLAGSISFNSQPAAAIGSDLGFQALSFQPEAELFRASSNLSPGFSQRYENVATIDGVVIDALVTVVGQSGNVGNELSTFDQYDNTQHLSAHTEPSGSAEASGKIRTEFLADGTSTPVVIKNLRASIADIDAHEFGTFYGISRYRLASGSQLSRSGSTAGVYRFHSSTTAGSNTDELRILEVDYDAASSLTTEFGCRANANGVIGVGGKCGFTVVIGTIARTLGVVETAAVRPTYSVTYNANTCTTGAVPAPSTGTGEIVITANTGSLASPTGVFLGWNTLANGTGVSFPPGYTFVPTENMVLYARCGTAPAPPTADNETSTGALDVDQIIDVLVGDAAGTGSALNPSSVRLCTVGTPDVSCTSTSLFVSGEGTYTVDPQTGVVTFNPLPTFSGPATSIKYVVQDSTGQLASATITPEVTSGSNPNAVDDTEAAGAYDTNQTVSPLGNDTAGSVSAPLVLSSLRFCPTSATAPFTSTNCSLVPSQLSPLVTADGKYWVDPATGVVTFDPDSGFTGTVTEPVQYVVADSLGQEVTAKITLSVSPSTSLTATAETKSVLPGGTISFTAITGSSGLASGAGLQTSGPGATCLVDVSVTPNTCGTGFTNADGVWSIDQATGVVTFVANNPLASGTKTSVTYRVTDSGGQTATSTLTPVVPPPPVAVDDTQAAGAYDTNQTISPLGNDTAGSVSAPLVLSSLRFCPTSATAPFTSTNCSLVPTQGSPLVTADGEYWVDPATGVVTFDPNVGFTGTVTQPVQYVVADSLGQQVTAKITLSVSATPTTVPPRVPPTLATPPTVPPPTVSPSPVEVSVPPDQTSTTEIVSIISESGDAGNLPKTGSDSTLLLAATAVLVVALGTFLATMARRKSLS
jgi:LPXTG-motif cell wall-anchored protein